MRFLSFRTPDQSPVAPASWGFLDVPPGIEPPSDPDSAPDVPVVDVGRLARSNGNEYPRSLAELLTMAPSKRAAVMGSLATPDVRQRTATVPLGEVELAAPVPEPRRNMFAVGANYRDHADESPYSPGVPDRPIFFSKATTAVTGPGAVIVDPGLTTKVDWEVELAVVIGTRARALTRASAIDAIFGYATANDLSARDQQHGRPEGQWFLGKSLDCFCPLGPWLVTRDEVTDLHKLSLSLTVNGQSKQKSNTSHMIFTVADLLVELSRFVTLLPGDVILTGTPAGVGDAKNPPEYLTHGDVVEAEVEGLGLLRSSIVVGGQP